MRTPQKDYADSAEQHLSITWVKHDEKKRNY